MFTAISQLLKETRAKLVARGTSLAAFSKKHGFHRQAVTAALSGQRAGPKSVKLGQEFLAQVERTK